MKVRLAERLLAREFRKQGFSFSEIMGKIPNLSKGTLSGWLKDIELTEKQKERLLEKIKSGSGKGRAKGAFANHQKRIEKTKYIIDVAKSEAKKRIVDTLFLIGVMLYWAEGDKTQERVGFTNSNQMMIQLMMKWFREICEVPETKFRVTLSIMMLHDKKESERFWSRTTRVSLNQFNKTHIKPTLLKGKRNPSYMGTCRIVISDKNLFRKMLGWRLGILESLQLMPL
ncbi:hypothetical protein KKE78_01800 [Patescibacteria group bacterium]|nr:hypothetical protein [Patescibacteria group bacterium]